MTLLKLKSKLAGERVTTKQLLESNVSVRIGKQKLQRAKNVGDDNPLTQQFDGQLKAAGIGGYVKDITFHPTRRWRFDRAWEDLKIAVEINGGTAYSAYKMIVTNSGVKRVPSSRHISPEGYRNDREKVNAAQALGWAVYEFDAKHIKENFAVPWLLENTRLRECVGK